MPEFWTVYRLKNLATVKNGQDYKSVQTDNGCLITGSGGQSTFASKFIYDKPFVLLGRKGTINKPLYMNELLQTAGTIYYMELNEGFDAKYFHYPVFTTQFSRYSTNTVPPSMTQERSSNHKFSVPKIESERKKVTEFLDPETAKIDNLTEKQQQLIGLLKEKHQAVISHVVTKRLDPDMSMRDSDVEWLRKVLEHWEVSKSEYTLSVTRGSSLGPADDPALFNGDCSPWVTIIEIIEDNEIYLDSTDTFLIEKGSERCRVFKAGTLLLSDSGATLGVPKVLSIDANMNDGVAGFELLNIDHEYAYLYLSTLITSSRESIKQGSGQPNLNTEIAKSIIIPIPPENEIRRVISFIKEIIKLYSSIESGAME